MYKSTKQTNAHKDIKEFLLLLYIYVHLLVLLLYQIAQFMGRDYSD